MPLVVSQITVIDALYSCCCAKFPQEARRFTRVRGSCKRKKNSKFDWNAPSMMDSV